MAGESSKKRAYLIRYVKHKHYTEESRKENLLYRSPELLEEKRLRVLKRSARLRGEVAAVLEQIDDPRLKQIAEMKFLDGLSDEEIAKYIGRSVGTCRALICKVYKVVELPEKN